MDITAPDDVPNDQRPRAPRVCVLGATFGTGNLGVDALGISMVQGLAAVAPDIDFIYQTWGNETAIEIQSGDQTITCDAIAIRRKGSVFARDGIEQIERSGRRYQWMRSRSFPAGPFISRPLRKLLQCDAVLDISAGDSFADTYGENVFSYQLQVKSLCQEVGLPLVLMPQTYGPFERAESAADAARVISRSALVCTREEDGVAEIETLCGDRRPAKIVRTPDVAFLLEPRACALPPRFVAGIEAGGPRIALNISGLLYFAKDVFGLRCDYAALARRLLRWSLSIPNGRVLMVPHVVLNAKARDAESRRAAFSDTTDTAACDALLQELSADDASRVDVLRGVDDPATAKFAISQCDFFVGARMHAFIGAASQCVPGALLAYSKKANGLARYIGVGDSVVDMRASTVNECVFAIDALYERRAALRLKLETSMPDVKSELRRFYAEDLEPLIRAHWRKHAVARTNGALNAFAMESETAPR